MAGGNPPCRRDSKQKHRDQSRSGQDPDRPLVFGFAHQGMWGKERFVIRGADGSEEPATKGKELMA